MTLFGEEEIVPFCSLALGRLDSASEGGDINPLAIGEQMAAAFVGFELKAEIPLPAQNSANL